MSDVELEIEGIKQTEQTETIKRSDAFERATILLSPRIKMDYY
jgi:hypothetical protein